MGMCACEHTLLTTLKPFEVVLTLITWWKGEGWDTFPLINAGLFVSKLWIFIICSPVQLLELMDSYAKTCPLWLRIVPAISWTCYSTFRNLSPPIRELILVKVCLLWRRFSHKWKKCEPVQLGKIWSCWLAAWFMCSKNLLRFTQKNANSHPW